MPDYKALLASTGEEIADDLAARFSIDIRSRKFWKVLVESAPSNC